MNVRAKVNDIWQLITPYLGIAAFAAVCVALFWLFPARTAAVLLGILVAVAIYYLFLNTADRAARLAVFWASAAVTADAAYAKLNDQAPVTILNGVAKFGEAIVRLVEGMIRSTGLLQVPEARLKLAPATPEFFWALILALLVLMVVNFFTAKRQAPPAKR